MKGVVAVGAAAVALAAPEALGHPGHGPVVVTVGGFAFTPATVDVINGESVLWYWDGPDTDHSVTFDAGQAETFDSDPSGPPSHARGSSVSHTFTHEGTFTYHCKVHLSMRGTVNVFGGAPAPADAVAPRPRGLSVRGDRIRFRLAEAAQVAAKLAPVGRTRPRARTFRFFARLGRNSVRFSRRGLTPGTYRLTLTLTDAAANVAKDSTRFRIPRPRR